MTKLKVNYKKGKGQSDEYILVFFTGNKNKIKEIETILGDKYPFLSVDIDAEEVQAVSVEKVAKMKLKTSYDMLKELIDNDKLMIDDIGSISLSNKKLIMAVEDTGLGFEGLGSFNEKEYGSNFFPGALIKFYYKSLGPSEEANKKITKTISGSKAQSITCIGAIKDDEMHSFCGYLDCRVSNEPRGTEGFDFDFILELPNGKTVGEISNDEKNKISPRGQAVKKMLPFLKDIKIAKLSEKEYGNRILKIKE